MVKRSSGDDLQLPPTYSLIKGDIGEKELGGLPPPPPPIYSLNKRDNGAKGPQRLFSLFTYLPLTERDNGAKELGRQSAAPHSCGPTHAKKPP
jgi:hypothetical protein